MKTVEPSTICYTAVQVTQHTDFHFHFLIAWNRCMLL